MGFDITHMITFGHLLDHARRTHEWVVVVASESCASVLLRMLPGLAPTGSSVAGRTVLLPGGGRLTLCNPSQEVDGEGYRLTLLGFDGTLLPREEIALHSWRKQAKGTLSLGDRPGELKING